MFYHLYHYNIKCLLKNKFVFFWSICFPFILGTLFKLSFDGGMDSSTSFSSIPVGIVIDASSTNLELLSVMEQVTYEDGSAMFDITVCDDLESAYQLLEESSVLGIIEVNDTISLKVKNSSIKENMIKLFLDRYKQTIVMVNEIAKTSPEYLSSVLTALNTNKTSIRSISINGNSTNTLLQYYYALIGMACLFGCFIGLENATNLQANLSALGTRRCVTPTYKLKLLAADILAALTIHFLGIVLITIYLRFVLKIDIGIQTPLYLLTCLIGSLIGISIGYFFGSVSTAQKKFKDSMLTISMLFFSFLSGLMIVQMKDIVEKHVPILNRINPATLITDCFYSLTVYSDYDRFLRNLITLSIIAFLLCIGSYLLTRREKYASI